MICYKHAITEKEIEALENCIKECLKLHSKFYYNQYPKLHYLVHLPPDIRKHFYHINICKKNKHKIRTRHSFCMYKIWKKGSKFKRFAENSNFLNMPLTASKKHALNLDLKKVRELAEKHQVFCKNGKIHKMKF